MNYKILLANKKNLTRPYTDVRKLRITLNSYHWSIVKINAPFSRKGHLSYYSNFSKNLKKLKIAGRNNSVSNVATKSPQPKTKAIG